MLKNKKYHIFFSSWLATLITLVALIIVVGGLTRLTESGLSITKWELFAGILPPLSTVEWEKYFLQYKEIPQFILLNSQMTLDTDSNEDIQFRSNNSFLHDNVD